MPHAASFRLGSRPRSAYPQPMIKTAVPPQGTQHKTLFVM
jgi:hypothetical protein